VLENGTVLELIEEDTELQLVSVTESQVLTPYSSEDKDTTVDVEMSRLSSPRETEDTMDIIHNTGTVKVELSTTSEDVGPTDKPKPSIPLEDGIVLELTEEDTELQLVSVTELLVLPLISLEVKDTTVDVEIPRLSSPKETEDIMDIIHNTGTAELHKLTTSENVGLTDKLKPSGIEVDGLVSELIEEDIELQPVSVTE